MLIGLSALLLFVGCHRDKDPGESTDDTSAEVDTTPPEPQPIDITGWQDNVGIALESGATQGEPAAIALPNGTIFASWMETLSSSSKLYVTMTHSTDNGQTWSEPYYVDEDRIGWQNDPVFAYADGRLIYTWLAVESYDASKSTIYCIESTDDGETWSEKIALSPENTFVDRQWMASRDDKVIITWDSFPDDYTDEQVYAESTTGCAGLTETTTITDGVFLNGVPAIDANGDVWVARNEFARAKVSYIVTKRTDDGWEDHTIQTYEYPDGAYYAMYAEHGEEEERPGEEHEPTFPGIFSSLEIAEARLGLAPGMRLQHAPTARARGTFDGMYSPVLVALPDGGVGVVTLATDATDTAYGDVYYMHINSDGTTSDPVVVHQDEGAGNPQMEPWLVVDAAGGLHVTWYDGREEEWRLYNANSLDGGETWTELQVGDHTFERGFDENTYADMDAWVGHFQGLVTSDEHVTAIFGSSHEEGISRIYSATSVSE